MMAMVSRLLDAHTCRPRFRLRRAATAPVSAPLGCAPASKQSTHLISPSEQPWHTRFAHAPMTHLSVLSVATAALQSWHTTVGVASTPLRSVLVTVDGADMLVGKVVFEFARPPIVLGRACGVLGVDFARLGFVGDYSKSRELAPAQPKHWCRFRASDGQRESGYIRMYVMV